MWFTQMPSNRRRQLSPPAGMEPFAAGQKLRCAGIAVGRPSKLPGRSVDHIVGLLQTPVANLTAAGGAVMRHFHIATETVPITGGHSLPSGSRAPPSP
jgi:hypothetical protein